jgi:hypothetical protein
MANYPVSVEGSRSSTRTEEQFVMHGGSKFSETLLEYADAWRKKIKAKMQRRSCRSVGGAIRT